MRKSSLATYTLYFTLSKKSHGSAWLIAILLSVSCILALYYFSESKKPSISYESYDSAPTQPLVQYIQDTLLIDVPQITKIKTDKYIIEKRSGKDNVGNEYQSCLSCGDDYPYNEIVFNLSRRYDTFSAVWALDNEHKNTTRYSGLEIYADNILIYKGSLLTAGSLPESICIPISGCNILTILFTDTSGGSLFNAQLSNTTPKIDNESNGYHTPGEIPVWLVDLEYLSKDQYITASSVAGFKDNTGMMYANYIKSSHDNQCITYYLGGKYSKIAGTWLLTADGKNTSHPCQFDIFADDALVYSSPQISGKAGSLPTPFEVPILNCQKLTIYFNSAGTDSLIFETSAISNAKLFP